MKTLSKTKKTLLVTLIINFLVWGAYGFVFLKIRSQNEYVSNLLNESNNDLKKDETLRAIKTTLTENKQFISHIDSYFVAKDGVVDFIEILESYALKSGVALTIGAVSVEQDPKVKVDFKEVLRLKVDASGSWENITRFLSVIENMPYVTDINMVSLSRNGGINGLNFDGQDETNNASNLVERSWKGYFEFTVLKLK